MHTKKPLPHQKKALADIQRGLKTHNRGKVLMATGTGKTLVAWWAAREHAQKSIVVFVPSLALARQLYQDWRDPAVWKNGADARWLAVCSDLSVTREDGDDISMEELKDSVGDGNVVNDPLDIAKFLKEKSERLTIVICTYQSAPVLAEGMPARFKFDLGIFDEAHKTAGDSRKLFSFALLDKNLRIRNRLFFTATPRRGTYKARPGEKEEIFHMDDPKTYGPVFHELSYKSALDQGLVADYDVLLAVIQRPDLKRVDILTKKDQALLAKTLMVSKAAAQHGIRKIFSFHDTNIAAEMAKRFYEEHGRGFKVYRVSGDQSAIERDNTLQHFRDDKKAIVTNARCLGEGVNVPVCDAVAFLTPRRSKVDVIQAVGRACRLNREVAQPKKAYVILPIFLEAGESLDEAQRRSAFGDAFETLNALREHNSTLGDELRRLREQVARGPEAGGPPRLDEGKIKIVVDEALQGGVAGMAIEEFKRSFRVHMAQELRATPKEKMDAILELAREAARKLGRIK